MAWSSWVERRVPKVCTLIIRQLCFWGVLGVLSCSTEHFIIFASDGREEDGGKWKITRWKNCLVTAVALTKTPAITVIRFYVMILLCWPNQSERMFVLVAFCLDNDIVYLYAIQFPPSRSPEQIKRADPSLYVDRNIATVGKCASSRAQSFALAPKRNIIPQIRQR